MKNKIIIHVDMDAFFAAVEELDNPDIKYKPVIIGSDPKSGYGRGVVSTCNYKARKYGVHSAMPISTAYKLCPKGIFIHPNPEKYREMSRRIMNILKSFTPYVEQISVDEAFLDCTGCDILFGSPEVIGKKIKNIIFDETGLTCSVGIAPNRSIAKIASDYEKPDGLTIIKPGKEKFFLKDLPIKKLWGVGEKTQEYLQSIGIFYVKDIINKSEEYFKKMFGKSGTHIWNMANGIDNREVTASEYDNLKRKSISEERTFENDINSKETCKKIIFKLVDDITRNMRKEKIFGKTVTVKIRLEGFKTFTRSITIDTPVNDSSTISYYALKLFDEFNNKSKKYRLIGVQTSNFIDEEKYNPGLFDKIDDKNLKVDKALDEIKNKFGKKIINRAVFIYKDENENK